MAGVMDSLKIWVKSSEMKCAADLSANGSNLSSPDDLCTSILHRFSITTRLETRDKLKRMICF